MLFSSGGFLQGGGEGGGNQQRLALHARGGQLRFHALVNDAFVRGVHVHDDHAGGVFGQHVDAVDLRDGAA